MNFRRLFFASLVVVPGFASADFLNGSFELPALTPGDQMPVSGTQLTDWTISGGDGADIITNQFVGDAVTWNPTPDGNQFLYLNEDVAGGVVLSQVVSLAAGSNELQFLQADFGTTFETPGGQVDVTILNSSNAVVVGPTLYSTPDFSGFISQSLNFTAASAGNYTVEFTSISGHAGILDGVTIASTPEPCSMLALAAGAVAIARRRQTKRSK